MLLCVLHINNSICSMNIIEILCKAHIIVCFDIIIRPEYIILYDTVASNIPSVISSLL